MPKEQLSAQTDEKKRLGIFLSYASEDRDIVEVFAKQFSVLNGDLRDGLRVFRDTTNIGLGHSIPDVIVEQLQASDYLIVFYTGQLKLSHGWTGVEVGYYLHLKKLDKTARRKIVPIYFTDPPKALEDLRGISLQMSETELGRPPHEFEMDIRKNQELAKSDLAELFKEIAGTVVSYAAPEGFNRAHQEWIVATFNKIEEEILPNIFIGMHKCLGRRVASRSIEQKLLEIEIEQFDTTQPLSEIPADARLIPHSNALELFGLEGGDKRPTWSEFQSHLRRAFPGDSDAILRAIERVFYTAVAPPLTLDNDQIIRPPSGDKTYRVIVTRHFDYYNGKKVVHLYFIEVRKPYEFGTSPPSLLVSFINVSTRYRFLFLEPDSEFSPRAFALIHSKSPMESKIRRLQQELTHIEDDSTRMQLNGPRATAALWGRDSDLDKLGEIPRNWAEQRAHLKNVGDALIACEKDEEVFLAHKSAWIEQLSTFTSVASAINREIGLQALKRLEPYYAGEGAPVD